MKKLAGSNQSCKLFALLEVLWAIISWVIRHIWSAEVDKKEQQILLLLIIIVTDGAVTTSIRLC
ncbi:hypothetical protein JCM10914A_02100 [Paenibacillus sp. JCM 10914]|uniref:hypothetical protein n=1 Tax=Paenibacillus sp. JCM 10914 TaxID=1236974 RepID=UPI0003CC78FF|nr:hypothetical protein [Paenibacillus sp. JCM 10914]GAE06859.1 hypothetical protein JCM10914_3046 [Paenibacillus sp. JCM 10914]